MIVALTVAPTVAPTVRLTVALTRALTIALFSALAAVSTALRADPCLSQQKFRCCCLKVAQELHETDEVQLGMPLIASP